MFILLVFDTLVLCNIYLTSYHKIIFILSMGMMMSVFSITEPSVIIPFLHHFLFSLKLILASFFIPFIFFFKFPTKLSTVRATSSQYTHTYQRISFLSWRYLSWHHQLSICNLNWEFSRSATWLLLEIFPHHYP